MNLNFNNLSYVGPLTMYTKENLFKNIKIGDYFSIDKQIFMKMNCEDEIVGLNAVCLNTGIAYVFSDLLTVNQLILK